MDQAGTLRLVKLVYFVVASEVVVLNSCASDGFAYRTGSINKEVDLDILEDVEIDVVDYEVDVNLCDSLELFAKVYLTKFVEERSSFLFVIRNIKNVSTIALISQESIFCRITHVFKLKLSRWQVHCEVISSSFIVFAISSILLRNTHVEVVDLLGTPNLSSITYHF